MSDAGVIIEGKNLHKRFKTGFFRTHQKEAVSRVDIRLHKHEVVTMIGESGSGKSTLGRILLTQIKPDDGEILFKNLKITRTGRYVDPSILRKMQIISQNPENSFDPRWTLKKSLIEPIILEKESNNSDYESSLLKMIHDVGMQPEHLDRYPHELSGGELQRLNIARNLSMDPEFLICDEATAMLDVSTQAFILQYLLKISRERDLALLFITHNIELARILGDRVMVMYQGKIIEEGEDVLISPYHPYTRELVAAEDLSSDTPLKQQPISDRKKVSTCGYAPYCPLFNEACFQPLTWQTTGKGRVLCNTPLIKQT